MGRKCRLKYPKRYYLPKAAFWRTVDNVIQPMLMPLERVTVRTQIG